jgi:serine/threonine-protein kinase RsbW
MAAPLSGEVAADMGGNALISSCASDARLHVTLVNIPAAMESARRAVLEFLAPYALAAPALFNVELVLEETLMNLARHAFDQPAGVQIEFTISITADAITLHFEDEGIAFDPRQAPEPTRPTSLADAAPGGLGLMLVRKRARSVHYERKALRNYLTITVARQ